MAVNCSQVHSRKYKCRVVSCVRLFATPWTIACQAPLSMGFSRQEYWSGLPFPTPGDLPDLGIEPASPALQAYSLPSEPLGKPKWVLRCPGWDLGAMLCGWPLPWVTSLDAILPACHQILPQLPLTPVRLWLLSCLLDWKPASSTCCGHWLEPPYGSRCGSRSQETPEGPPPSPSDTHSPSALGSRVLLPATSVVTGSTGFPEHFSFLHAW